MSDAVRAVPTLETARLILRPLELADAETTQRLFPQWEIVRYLNDLVPWPYPPDGAETFYREMVLPAMARGEAWHWSLRLKVAPNDMIGSICLTEGERDNRGFWLGLPWQGQGLMTEACEAATDFWFEVLGKQRLRVPKAVDNAPSRHISVSSGMRVVASETQGFVGGKLPAEVWEITRDEWRARGRPSST